MPGPSRTRRRGSRTTDDEGEGIVRASDDNARRRGVACRYRRGGLCLTHGPGATRKWKPDYRRVVGQMGQMTTEKGRQYYYICDLGAIGRLRQTRLPFAAGTTPARDDTEQRGAEHSHTTVGQQADYEG